MADHHLLTFYAEVSEEDAVAGIPKIKALLADLPCRSLEISHVENKININVAYDEESNTDSIIDRVSEAIGEVFPGDPDSQPVEFLDDDFGRLIHHPEFSWFEGSFEMPGEDGPVDLFIDATPDAPRQKAIKRIKQIIREWTHREAIVHARIAQQLLDLYNNEWREHDEDTNGALDAQSFCSRLSLCSFAIDSDLTTTLKYFADGMFTEHGITATISNSDEIDAWME